MRSPAPDSPESEQRRSRRSFLALSAGVVAAGVAGLAATNGILAAADRADTSPSKAAEVYSPLWRPGSRLFAADSPWNQRIPEDPAIDRNSSAIGREVLRSTRLVVNAAIYAYGIPFYTATSSTPMVHLTGRGALADPIPLDPSWKPNTGGDRKLNVLDPDRGLVYELQGYQPAKRSVYWAVVRDIVGGSGDGRTSRGRRGPTGSGMSQAGGVIRIAEIRSGSIDHALSFITANPADGFRYPATHGDGSNRSAGAIEEGMRVQLDPALDLDGLGLGKAERAIARALQMYGAFCTDTGAGNNMAMGFYAEKPTAVTGDPYRAAGLDQDWAQLKRIPRSALRVIAASVTRP